MHLADEPSAQPVANMRVVVLDGSTGGVRELASGVDALYLSGHGYLPKTFLHGGALRYSNWRRRVWLPAAKAAGCEGAGFHDLRRLNATTLVVGGIDVKTAQVRLGHADPRMTLAIYASAPASVDRSAADVIGERFLGRQPSRHPNGIRHEMFRAICAPFGSDVARHLRILRP
jgi:integrase